MTRKALHLNQFCNLKGANNKRQKQSSVPEFFQENCSKIESTMVGPNGGDTSIGCGVGVRRVGGVGLGGSSWNHLRVAFGVGMGCGVGVEFGFGQGYYIGVYEVSFISSKKEIHNRSIRGHGYTDGGLKAHIPNINPVVDDCVAFFNSFHDRHVPLELPSFLYAKSLGVVIALLITLRRGGSTPKQLFNIVVLNGVMCGISDQFKPSWPLDFTISDQFKCIIREEDEC
nr:caffeoylshikimate esterase-like [Ipomoea batatas]